MPPKFSLQTVLDVRHSRAEALEVEFSKLLAREQLIFGEIKNLESTKESLMSQLHEQMTGEMDLFVVAHLRANINQHSVAIEKCHQSLVNLQKEIENKRRQLISARQAEETLDILKRKEIKRYKALEVEHENKEQDDVYISQNFQKRQEVEINRD
jgi:flagellar export protein FliJ